MSKNIFSQFDKHVQKHNQDIEYYRKLAPKLMPIIKIYQKETQKIYLNLTYCIFYFKNEKTPVRFYHVLDENELIGSPICQNGLGISSTPIYSEVLVSLK